MNKTGHQGAALLLYAPVGLLLVTHVDPEVAGLAGAATLALAMLPDIDLKLPFVPHRGPTHTLLFLALVTAATTAAGVHAAPRLPPGPLMSGVVGGSVGVVAIGSHLAADAITPSGVPLLWPVSRHDFTLGLVRASNPLANTLLLTAGAGACLAAASAAGIV